MYRANSPLGYYSLTDAEVLHGAVASLGFSDEDTHFLTPKEIDELLKEMFTDAFGKDNYLIRDVDIIKLSQMAITSKDAKPLRAGLATPRHALALIISRYLKFNQRVAAVPDVIAYREDPSCTIDELVVLTLNRGIEKVGMELPPPSTIILPIDLRQAVLIYVDALRRHFTMSSQRIVLLRDYINEIGYKLQNSLITPDALSQFDRSFIAHLTSMQYGMTQTERKTSRFFVGIHPERRREDKMIMEMIDEVKKHVLEGPKLRFLSFMSNGTPEDLVVYIGAYTQEMLSSVGFLLPFGGFSRINTVVHDKKSWDANAHIRAITEMYPSFQTERPPAALSETGAVSAVGTRLLGGDKEGTEQLQMNIRMYQGPAGKAAQLDSVLDNPEFIWLYQSMKRTNMDGNKETVGSIILNYPSKWRKRILYNQRSQREILIDKALSTQKLANGGIQTDTGAPPAQMGLMTLDKFQFVDLRDSDRLKPLKTKVNVQFVRDGKVSFQEVDLRAFFEGVGNKVVKPAFSQYYLVRPDDFKIEDKVNEERLAQRLGLSVMERYQSDLLIRASWNAYRLREWFDIKVPHDTEFVVRTALTELTTGRRLTPEERATVEANTL